LLDREEKPTDNNKINRASDDLKHCGELLEGKRLQCRTGARFAVCYDDRLLLSQFVAQARDTERRKSRGGSAMHHCSVLSLSLSFFSPTLNDFSEDRVSLFACKLYIYMTLDPFLLALRARHKENDGIKESTS